MMAWVWTHSLSIFSKIYFIIVVYSYIEALREDPSGTSAGFSPPLTGGNQTPKVISVAVMLHDIRSQIRYEYFLCYWAKVRYDSRWTSIPFKGKGGRSSTAKAINIGNGGERSPIQSIILRVIEKIGRPRSYQSRDLSITSMMTDRIRHHKVLLPINHNHYNFEKKNPNTSRTNISARDNVYNKKFLHLGNSLVFFQDEWLLLLLLWSIVWLVDLAE